MSTNMYVGFCSITDLIINGSTSAIGEMDNTCITYSKEPAFYSNQNNPCQLAIFRGISETSDKELLPDTHKTPILNMFNWLYEQAKQGNTTDSTQACLQILKTQYSSNWVWNSVGKMVTNNSIWMPSYLEFAFSTSNVTHTFKIWLAHEYFEVEFPYREIFVAHPVPVDSIDTLIDLNFKQLQIRLNAETPDKIETRVQQMTNGNPYTKRIVIGFDVYDLVNKPNKVKAFWTIIYYGNPNDAEEETYEKIKQEILANSKYDENKWAEVIPDLFNPLEFIAVPYWNEYGLLNETVLGSTYSPIYRHKNGARLPIKYAPFYEETHVIESLQIVPHLHKSIKIGMVGKPTNNGGRILITDIYPEYQLIPFLDNQSGVMDKETREFVGHLEEMLAAAEIVTPDGIPPKGMQRVVKNGKLYLTKRSNKVKLTMATRYQFIQDGEVAHG